VHPDHRATHTAGQWIESVAQGLATRGLEVHPVIREGDAGREILHLSEDIRADLIVMRTRGSVGIERALFGSVTEEVLKRTNIPVLLVRPGRRCAPSIRELLVPLDGSPASEVALETAVGLARCCRAAIHVLQVAVPVPMMAYANPHGISGASYYDSAWDDQALLEARAYVDSVRARLHTLGLDADGEARVEQSVPDAITTAADRVGADLIVMTTRARTGAARISRQRRGRGCPNRDLPGTPGPPPQQDIAANSVRYPFRVACCARFHRVGSCP
jgi:nucleotide-binding universal stress UspA family protein